MRTEATSSEVMMILSDIILGSPGVHAEKSVRFSVNNVVRLDTA